MAPQIVMSFYEEEHGQRKRIHQLIVASVSGKTRDESAESEATRVHGRSIQRDVLLRRER